MCGIAGVYQFKTECNEGSIRETLAKMHNHLAHRGPDGDGIWYSGNGRVGLSHRRLAIIDPGPSGAQPMQSHFGDHTISYNGEIYNFVELKAKLQQQGYQFRTDSDTEVLLGLYHCYGDAMTEHLRGMYSLAIWDGPRQGLFICRDPYGIKPLYYAQLENRFLFASEVNALAQTNQISLEKSLAGEASFLMLGSVMEPHTYYKNIFAIPAGHSLWIDRDGIQQPKAFQKIADLFHNNDSEISCHQGQAVTAAFKQSVAHHLVADVPVGIFLSAGIDSGAIATLVKSSMKEMPQSITLGFDEYKDTANDETVLAAEMARQLGIQHTIRRVDQAEFNQDLELIFQRMDQPTIDGINTWFVSKAAAEKGMKVMLSGVGGDELLGGYPSFEDIPKWMNRYASLANVPGCESLMTGLGKIGYQLPVSPKAFGFPHMLSSVGGAYLLRRGIFMPWELPAMMGRERAEEGLFSLDPIGQFNGVAKSSYQYPAIAALESHFYLRNQLLRDTDWASMAHSIEVRTPLVDIELTKIVNPAVRSNPGKHWLSEGLSTHLPTSVKQRSKTGFTTPIGNWLMKNKRLDHWRKFPMLKHDHVHWSRRYAACIHQQFFG